MSIILGLRAWVERAFETGFGIAQPSELGTGCSTCHDHDSRYLMTAYI